MEHNTCGVMSGAGPDFLTAALFFWDDADIILISNKHMIKGKDKRTPKTVTTHSMDATWLNAHIKGTE